MCLSEQEDGTSEKRTLEMPYKCCDMLDYSSAFCMLYYICLKLYQLVNIYMHNH